MPQYPTGAASSSNPPPNSILGAAGVVGVPGLTWLGTWNASTAYLYGSAVAYGGSSYVAVEPNIGVTPGTSAFVWVLIAQGGSGTSGDVSSDTVIPSGGNTSRTLAALWSDIINVKGFGATGSQQNTTGSISSGSQSLTVASAVDFAAGNGIAIAGAGVSGAALITSVVSVVGTTITVQTAASTGVTGAAVTHDDSVSIASAWSYALSLGIQTPAYSGSLSEFAKPCLFFPCGYYQVSWVPSSSTGGYVAGGMTILGEQAIIAQTNPANNIFTLAGGGQHVIEGIGFWGGAYQIAASFGYAGDAVTSIRNCEFMTAAKAGIYTDLTSPSASFNVEDCHFYAGTNGGIACEIHSSDQFTFLNNYVGGFSNQSAGKAMFQLGDASGGLTNFDIKNMSGGPGSGNATETYWFNVYSGSYLWIEHGRYGGENGGMCLVKWNPSSAYVGGGLFVNDVFCYHTGGYLFEFYALPSECSIRNSGGSNSGPVYFDSSIAQSDIDQLGSNYYFDTDGSFGAAYPSSGITRQSFPAVQTSYARVVSAAVVSEVATETCFVEASDMLQTISSQDYGNPWVPGGAATTTHAYLGTVGPFGQELDSQTATAAGQYFTTGWSDALINVPVGTLLTFVQYVKVNVPVNLQVVVSNSNRVITLLPGEWIVNVPAVMGSTSSVSGQLVSGAYNLPSGAVVTYGPLRALLGWKNISTVNAVVNAATAPSAGSAPFTSGQYLPGDTVLSTAVPASGNPWRWVCTVAGRYAPSWQASTAYVIGNLVFNNTSHIYHCTAGGTSAGSGGPTGTGSGISDGGVTWEYIAPTPTFIASLY